MNTDVLQIVPQTRNATRSALATVPDEDITANGLGSIKGRSIPNVYVTIGIDKLKRLTTTFTGRSTAEVRVVARIYTAITSENDVATAENSMLSRAQLMLNAYLDVVDINANGEYNRVPQKDTANFIVGEISFSRILPL